MNLSFRLLPTADVLYAADGSFWRHYGSEINGVFTGECWTCDKSYADTPGMHVVESVDESGMSHVSTRVHRGGNSGYQALGLAANWGVSRIVLVGFDMSAPGGRRHFHPDHPEQLGNPIDFSRWVERFNVASRDLRALGVRVVNASEQTALTCFERVELSVALG